MKEKQKKILDEAIKIVPFDGWTNLTLTQATKNAGFDEKYAKIAFKGSVDNLVNLFNQMLEAKMLESISEDEINALNIRKRIIYCVKKYLEVSAPYKNVIRKNVAYYASPTKLSNSFKSVWHIADKIWYESGDDSTDFNHYTKRAILSAVFSSTLLYWLNDKSDNHKDTKDFLDRRIDNVMQIQKCKSKAKDFIENLFG